MSKELVPITQYPVAEMLPPYLDAERIVVNAGLVGKSAQWGCFFSDVQITGYSGPTSSESVGVAGFAGHNLAAAASVAATEAPLGLHQYPESEPPKNILIRGLMHPALPLNLQVNVPEIQQRLSQNRANLRDPQPWAKLLDSAVGQSLRDAAYAHLLQGEVCRDEFGRFLALNVLPMSGALTGSILGGRWTWEGNIGFPFLLAYATTTLSKAVVHILEKRRLAETCFSLFPGYHIDRYAAVWGLTRARRLVRPIK